MQFGDQAIEALKTFEVTMKDRVTVHTFKTLGSIADPADMEPLMKVMMREKTSFGELSTTISKAAKRQWYKWHIFHPDTQVHSERSVFL